MEYLPISIRISDARILIVGGGKVATHKAQILHRFTDKATVIAKEISDEIKALPFTTIERPFRDHELNHQIKDLASKRGILTSVCDDPAACDFISPAIYRQDNLTIAVGSDSRDVKRSIRVRNRIQQAIENGELDIE